jgi:DNA modification methylase
MLTDLHPAPWNPRKIDKARLRNLAESIKADPTFLLRRPILAQASGEIYAGNQRWYAAQLLFREGWTPPWGQQTVPADVDDVSDQVARERAVRDNNSWGQWEDDSLARLLGDLRDQDVDTGLLGFDDRELSQLLARIGTGKELNPDDADLTPPAEPITKPGDLWILGEHRLLCGDATKPEDVEFLLSGANPGLTVTDPPYGVNYAPEWRQEAAKQGLLAYAARRVGHVANDDRADWSEAWRLAPSDVLYSWHPAGAPSLVHAGAIQDSGFVLRMQIIWAKPHLPIGRGDYHVRHEPCWYAVRAGRAAQRTDDRTQSTLWEIPLDRNVEGGHSTQKPVECMARPIRNHCFAEVYDPFIGSGTTLVAAEQLGRKCYAMEIEPAYCDVAVRRWERVSGQTAVLERHGG